MRHRDAHTEPWTLMMPRLTVLDTDSKQELMVLDTDSKLTVSDTDCKQG